MRLLLIFPIVALFSACVAFQPRVGMSLGELRRMTGKSFNGPLDLISADGTRSAYRVRHKEDNTVYVFEGDRLVSVEQAQNAQIRHQVEIIKK